jgi:hypothetical protein
MLTGRRSDVEDLNRRARTRLESTGLLNGPTLVIDGVPLQAGDDVMTSRNDRRLGVRMVAAEPSKPSTTVPLPSPSPSLPATGACCPLTTSSPAT